MQIAVYKDTLYNSRGADRAVKAFAAALADRGHDVCLLEDGDLRTSLNRHLDVVVATGSNEAVSLDRIGYLDSPGRARVVLQLHLAPRGFFKWKHPIRNWRIRRAFNKVDVVQVLCPSYVDEFRALAPRPEVVVIGNYTDRPLGEARPGNVILYPAATFSKVKNQALLIRAFSLIAKDFPDWQVRLLGNDTTHYADSCRRLVGELGLKDRVRIVGFTDDLAGEYGKAAFIAFPSRLEGFPLAVLEASRYALPSIAVDELPGVLDILAHGENGLVVESSPEAYAAGLRRLMCDIELRRSLGRRCKEYCDEHYSRDRVLDEWEKMFSRIV